jgi:hypothetical protein
MDYFYDGQVRRYVTQFMRVFTGFKYKTGGDIPEERYVPVLYGDMTRMVAGILKDNSENKMSTVPRMACYIGSLELDKERLSDPTFVSKVNIRERAYTKNEETGLVEYKNIQGGNYTVERLQPTPFKLTMKCDIWTSSTDQKLQLLEQILVLFNPSLELQTTDNYIDWTSLTVLNLNTINFSSRQIPQGAESEIDICTLEFDMPIWVSPPAKVKRLGIVKAIINNAFTETGDVVNLEGLVYNRATGNFNTTTDNYRVLLFKSTNGQPYDYDVTIADPTQAILSMGLDQKLLKLGNAIDWNAVLETRGGYTAGSQMYFDQPNGHTMVGTFAINPVDPSHIIVTFDRDTVPANTLINDLGAVDSNGRGTVDAIIDPYKFNPIEVYGSQSQIPTTLRYLMLDDVNNSFNVGGTIRDSQQYDGPDAWKNLDGSDPIIKANTVIRWTGTHWVTVFDPTTFNPPIYIQNLRTGIKYRWTGNEWLKAFEGEYAPSYWGFILDPK